MIVGAVLAAGAGSRYGMPKIRAQQGDWLRLAVAALADGGCDEVVVTMGASIVEPPAPARALVVPEWSSGLSAGVAAVAQSVRNRPEVHGAVLHVVDMPDVPAAAVRRVLEAAQGRRDALVRAVYRGQVGHPVYLGAEHIDPLLAVLAGDTGARRYLAGRADVELVDCSDLASGIDRDR